MARFDNISERFYSPTNKALLVFKRLRGQMADEFTNEEFHVEWEDASDSGLTWLWDASHWPNPLTPLSEDLTMRIAPDMTIEMGLKRSQAMRLVCAQGFIYMWRPQAKDSAATDPVLV